MILVASDAETAALIVAVTSEAVSSNFDFFTGLREESIRPLCMSATRLFPARDYFGLFLAQNLAGLRSPKRSKVAAKAFGKIPAVYAVVNAMRLLRLKSDSRKRTNASALNTTYEIRTRVPQTFSISRSLRNSMLSRSQANTEVRRSIRASI